MDLDANILINIIYNIDPTRIVSDRISKESLLRIANQVVTRALQFDPKNENLIKANSEILRIEDYLNKRSKQKIRSRINIDRNNVDIVKNPAVYKKRSCR